MSRSLRHHPSPPPLFPVSLPHPSSGTSAPAPASAVHGDAHRAHAQAHVPMSRPCCSPEQCPLRPILRCEHAAAVCRAAETGSSSRGNARSCLWKGNGGLDVTVFLLMFTQPSKVLVSRRPTVLTIKDSLEDPDVPKPTTWRSTWDRSHAKQEAEGGDWDVV